MYNRINIILCSFASVFYSPRIEVTLIDSLPFFISYLFHSSLALFPINMKMSFLHLNPLPTLTTSFPHCCTWCQGITVTHLPVLVMIISVPSSWNLSHSSFVSRWHCRGMRSSQLHEPSILGVGCCREKHREREGWGGGREKERGLSRKRCSVGAGANWIWC